jgi:hypothetical protein
MILMRISPQLISDDPKAQQPGIPYFGCVDGFSAQGLSGWVLNTAAPHTPLALELLVDGMAIPGATIATTPRPDLAAFFPAHVETAGFRLTPGSWEKFKTLIAIRPQADFAIKITGTNFILPRSAVVPSLAAITAAAAPPPRTRLDLLSRLTQLAQRATPLAANPAPDERKGLIEAICLDDIAARLCWFLGWTTEAHLHNEPAVILDGQKLPAAFAIATYPRADIPAGGVGFAGVLLSDWRPQEGAELTVCFGPAGGAHLRGVAGLKRISKAGFAAHIKTASAANPAGAWPELTALLHGPQSWLPAPRPDLHVAVDKLLALPGFGCFVTGWALSRLQQVQGFALKIGKTILPMDESSLYFRPRPDLHALFPESAPLLARAGFCCFFPAESAPDLSGEVLLKLFLEDGANVVPVQPSHLFRLGRAAPLETLLHLYPAIETEAFFPALAQFIRDDLSTPPILTPYKITPSPTTMIFTLAADRADGLLALEDIQHHARTHIPADCALTIIAGASQPHGEIIQMLESLPRTTSLVFVQNPETSFRALPELLLLLNAETFIFVPAGHFLSETGWNQAAACLAPGNQGLTIFGIHDPETLEEMKSSAGCFAWSWAAFSAWSLHMPVRLGALPQRQDVPASPAPQLAPRAAFIAKSTRLSRLDALLETAINA